MLPEKQPRCPHCHATTGLVRRSFYIGGNGYTWGWDCRDKPACWRRREAQDASASSRAREEVKQ